MTRLSIAFLAATLATLAGTVHAANFTAGKEYFVLPQAQQTHVAPGKVEVMEVFSYGCPACNQFRPTMRKLKAALPPAAQLVYLPASWHEAENWPTLQRAYLAAQSLGVADKAHEAMFDAVWKTGELSITDATGQKLKPIAALPKLEDIARFYERVAGVKASAFLAAARSFGVDLKVRQADSQIEAMQVPSTPTLVVAGKYRINPEQSFDQMIEVVKFLVAKESAAAARPAPKP
ncbi:MAG TPA: thiol:disulfide interchange protein DsbA/DsbL [Steroidobacteraceae bacterium]|nr:thiol:disulfide interchange protein DsbA/DsbL [Steroidobacteraceae bacterium]